MNKTLVFLLSLSLVVSPSKARADSPAGFIAVAAAYLALGTAVAVKVTSDVVTAVTTETPDSGGEGGGGGEEGSDPDSDSDSDSEDGGGGEEGLSGNATKPQIRVGQYSRSTYYQGEDTRVVYGNGIPSSLLTTVAARTASTQGRVRRGTGIELRGMSDAANVLLAKATTRRVSYRRTRRIKLLVQRKGDASKATNVPIIVNLKELRVSTTDVAGTNGAASINLKALVDNVTAFEIEGSVRQAQLPQFSGAEDAQLESRSDFGSAKNLLKTVNVRLGKGKRRAVVELLIESQGFGERV